MNNDDQTRDTKAAYSSAAARSLTDAELENLTSHTSDVPEHAEVGGAEEAMSQLEWPEGLGGETPCMKEQGVEAWYEGSHDPDVEHDEDTWHSRVSGLHPERR